MGVLLKKSELHVSVKRTDFYTEAQSDFFFYHHQVNDASDTGKREISLKFTHAS